MITNVSGGFGYCDECGNPIQVSDSDDVITCRCGKMHYWCGSENCREGESKMGARNIITQLTSQIEKLKKECEERCGKMNCMADDILSLECRNKSLQSSLDQQNEENKLLKDELEQHRWIPVEERLPEEYVIVCVRGKCGIGEARVVESEWFVRHMCFGHDDVTHWKPIILPRKEKENE